MRRAARRKEALKQGEHGGDATLAVWPGDTWIQQCEHMIRAGITHQEPEPLPHLSIREGCKNAGYIFKQHGQVGNGRLRRVRGIPPLTVFVRIVVPIWCARIGQRMIEDEGNPVLPSRLTQNETASQVHSSNFNHRAGTSQCPYMQITHVLPWQPVQG